MGLPEIWQAEVPPTGLFSPTCTDKYWIKYDKDKYLNRYFNFEEEREIPGSQKQKKKTKTSW